MCPKLPKITQNIIPKFLPAINFCRQIAGKAHVYVHAINANRGQTTLDEILSWIKNTLEHYKSIPTNSLKAAVGQTLWYHQAFYRKKSLKSGKTCGFWYVNEQLWISSQRRKKSKKITHKTRELNM